MSSGTETTLPHAALDAHCLAPTRRADASHDSRYGRLFPELEPLEIESEPLRILGRPGGPCDGGIVVGESRDSSEAAGWPVFGQFVAHDLTADRSPVVHHADAAALRNFRSPRLDLECVYGGGPVGSPYLFDRDDPAKLLAGDDLPRNTQGIALVGDPRNDLYLFMSQLHLAMLRVHNLVVDRLRSGNVPESALFDEARRTTTWHYQWIVLNDFLPRFVGRALAHEIFADGPSHFCGTDGRDDAYIPFEFADAAYRCGHGQIRDRYLVGGEELPMFPDLLGFRPVPADRVVDWATLFDLPGREPAQRARRIDARLPPALIDLPREITGELDDQDLRSLAVRDLERGSGVALPSGESVARALGADPLSESELSLPSGWSGETPLWYYLLKEAETRSDGNHLGPVGGRIVGEVLVGIVDDDPASFRSVDPKWRPTLAVDGTFGLAELLALSSEQ